MNDQNAKQEPLLPCPFCGSEPRRCTDPGLHFIDCRNDECPVLIRVNGATPEEAAAHWNRRPASTPADAPMDATGDAGEGMAEAMERGRRAGLAASVIAEYCEAVTKLERRIATLTAELAEERNQRQYFEELAIGKAATEAAEGLAKDGFISDAARSAGREGR